MYQILIEEIEQTRTLMIQTAVREGMTSPNTLQVSQSLDALLMPIAQEIVIPSQGVDIYCYVSTEEATINLKKKQKYDMDSSVAEVVNNH